MDRTWISPWRESLEGTPWWSRALSFGAAVRRTETPGGLLVVGTPGDEPWHAVAHLQDEADWSGLSQLRPTLLRWAPPPGAPPHLAVGLARLESARSGETVVIIAPEVAPQGLLERVADARRVGATILAIDAGDTELGALAHEQMIVDESTLWLPGQAASFDLAQHLVASAAGDREEPSRPFLAKLFAPRRGTKGR